MEKGKGGNGRRWAVEFTDNSTAPSSRDVPDPPGFTRASHDQDDSTLTRQKKDAEANWKAQKAWEVAQAPIKNFLMMGFMMWMAGSTVHLFSIGITFSALLQPLTALQGVGKVFEPYKDNKVDLIAPKLLYIALNVVCLGVGVWKLNTLGLLPTHASDWVSSLPPAQADQPIDLAAARRRSLSNLCTSVFRFSTMLKVPDHQVAGHQALNGNLGPLVDKSGNFYKPLQNGDRGDKEVAFYESFYSNKKVPATMHKFFSKFYGTQRIKASDGSGLLPHLVLEDIVSTYNNPSIMDIKMGSRTWYPQASDDYIKKCLDKDRKSTSLPLGFRISGLQVYNGNESGYFKPDRKFVKSFTVADVRLALRKFVSVKQSTDPKNKPDCELASNVYGGSSGILAQLMELKSWFEDQTMYQFNSCSILLVYDKESAMKNGEARAMVKLIDFAHVYEGEGIIDHNFLGGLCSFIKFISETLAELEGQNPVASGELNGQ
ncbi:hypothetical protein V2J09_019175 [Rumex salicifolius]